MLHYLLSLLCRRLLGCPRKPLQLSYRAGNITITGVNLMARMNNEQTIEVSVTPRTADGNPAAVDGPARFSADPAIGAFEQLTDTSARFTPDVGALGAAQIVVVVDADLGEGVRELTASGALEIVSPEAETLEVTFGEPQN